jgi:hypothetical protein
LPEPRIRQLRRTDQLIANGRGERPRRALGGDHANEPKERGANVRDPVRFGTHGIDGIGQGAPHHPLQNGRRARRRPVTAYELLDGARHRHAGVQNGCGVQVIERRVARGDLDVEHAQAAAFEHELVARFLVDRYDALGA